MILLEGVTREYRSASGPIVGLDNVSCEVRQGEFVCVYGPSGSGKTTLLLTVGGMQRPTSGQVRVAGKSIYDLSAAERGRFRHERIGFVFQLFHLLPYLSVLDNVRLGGGRGDGVDHEQAVTLIEQFGIAHRLRQKPGQLSVGERQRVALARALMGKPDVILADEPTGNLDDENAELVLKTLSEFSKSGGTVLVVTHGQAARQYADRVFTLTAGRLGEQTDAARAAR